MRLPLLVALLATVSCGGDGSKTLPAASPSPTPTSTLTLSGTVTETVPTQSTPLAGATVTIIDGPFVGKVATAGANGAFQLAVPTGLVMLVVRAANHVEQYEQVEISGNRSIAFELDPVDQTLTSTLNGTITGSPTCPGYWDGFLPTDPCGANYVIDVHYEGTLTADLTWTDPDTSPLLQLYRARDGQALEGAQTADGQQLSRTVEAHTQYVVHVRAFSNGGGPPPARVTSHSLVVKHPS